MSSPQNYVHTMDVHSGGFLLFLSIPGADTGNETNTPPAELHNIYDMHSQFLHGLPIF